MCRADPPYRFQPMTLAFSCSLPISYTSKLVTERRFRRPPLHQVRNPEKPDDVTIFRLVEGFFFFPYLVEGLFHISSQPNRTQMISHDDVVQERLQRWACLKTIIKRSSLSSFTRGGIVDYSMRILVVSADSFITGRCSR